MRSVGWTWLVVETVVGLALLFEGVAPHPRKRVAVPFAVGGFLVAIAYASLAFTAYFRHLDVPNCTCFGRYLAQPLSLFVLVQEVVVLLSTGTHLRGVVRWPR